MTILILREISGGGIPLPLLATAWPTQSVLDYFSVKRRSDRKRIEPKREIYRPFFWNPTVSGEAWRISTNASDRLPADFTRKQRFYYFTTCRIQLLNSPPFFYFMSCHGFCFVFLSADPSKRELMISTIYSFKPAF